MRSSIASRSRKRTVNSDKISESNYPNPVSGGLTIKKPKRAETRSCPVCGEPIPIRLLPHHAELELSRLDIIVQQIGLTEAITDVTQESEVGTSSAPAARRSAVKARKAINPRSAWATDAASSPFTTEKTIRAIKRRRKTRNANLRELGAQDEEYSTTRLTFIRGVDGNGHAGNVCPVCSIIVRGDQDVVDAHIDSCLAYAAILRERELAEVEAIALAEDEVDIDGEDDGWEEVEVDGEVRLRRTSSRTFRGTGFYVRNGTVQDVEDEVDIDGDNEDAFGNSQFTEGDVIVSSLDHAPIPGLFQTEGAETDSPENENDEDDENALRALVAAGDVVTRQVVTKTVEGVKVGIEEAMKISEPDKMSIAVANARQSGSKVALIQALEEKVKFLENTRISSSTSPMCRICLDHYLEPTVSTGCWHICCRECWLRCLGSTKLCPMCKRITQASELRRIYL